MSSSGSLRALPEPVRPRDEAGLEGHLHVHLEEELLVLPSALPWRALVHNKERERPCALGQPRGVRRFELAADADVGGVREGDALLDHGRIEP